MNVLRRASLITLSALVFTGLLVTPASARGGGFKAIHTQLRSGVVKIQALGAGSTQKLGTGFLFTRRNLVVTNYHVIAGARAVFAIFPNETAPVPCKLVHGSPQHDLALIKLDHAAGANRAVLSLAAPNKKPAALDEVLIIGHPKRLDWSVHKGEVSGIRKRKDVEGAGTQSPEMSVYQVDITAASGMSGAPVIAKDGKVLGVFYAGIDRGRHNLNFCIPHSYVRSLDTTRTATRFSAGSAPVLSGGFGNTGVNYLADNSLSQHENGPKRQFPIRSMHWGFVQPNPQTIYQNFVQDKLRFKSIIPYAHLQQLAAQKRLLHVTNSFFGYSLLVPRGYRIQESISPQGLFVSMFTMPGRNYGVRITALKVRRPANRNQAMALLTSHAAMFNSALMGVMKIVPQGKIPLNSPGVYELGPMSETTPRYDTRTGGLRFWRRYANHPQYGTSRLVLFAIERDVFFTVDIWFPTRAPALQPIPGDYVENLIMAHSFSAFP